MFARMSQLTASPVSPQVDAADAQVVSGADESGLQLQSSGVGFHRLLAAVAVGQRGAQTVPQQVVLKPHVTSSDHTCDPAAGKLSN